MLVFWLTAGVTGARGIWRENAEGLNEPFGAESPEAGSAAPARPGARDIGLLFAKAFCAVKLQTRQNKRVSGCNSYQKLKALHLEC